MITSPPTALLAPAVHASGHYERLRDEVARMIDEVPLYGGRPPPPLDDRAEAVSAWLAEQPVMRKRDLRRGFPRSLVRAAHDLKAEMTRGAVEIIATSGTTDDRLQVLWEWSWWDPQEREAMRYNRRVAAAMPEDKVGFREAVLTTPVCGGSTCHVGNVPLAERTIDGMLFLNQVVDPTHWNGGELDRMLGEWNDLRPDGVEADPAYLAALCRHAQARGRAMHSPSYATLTYELATRGHRRAISSSLASPLYSLYGATEAGVLFMECEAGRLHHNARHSHVELLRVSDTGDDDLGRVVVTTLGRAWMPLCRYELGDVVRVVAGPCPCGLDAGGYLLERLEGRYGDCFFGPRGLVTPAMIDDAIDPVEPGLSGWQLWREASGFSLRVVGPADETGGRAARAVAQLVDAPVAPRVEAAILPEGSGKYRLVKA
jgi:phenylacetate-coenzyme A ligase PaaK-like adenylate-forming protein